MACDFDLASTEYLRDWATPISGTPVTLAAWFRPEDDTAYQGILCVNSSGPAGHMFNLIAGGGTGGDPIRAHAYDGAVSVVANSTTGYALNTWHHGCAVFTGNTSCAAYIDGGSKGIAAGAITPAGFGVMAIASLPRVAGSFLFDGAVAEAAIWDVALTDAEVAVLATGIRPIMVRPQGLVCYWPLVRFNIAVVDAARDLVGHYDMSPVNTPTIFPHPPVIYGATPGLFGEGAGAGPTNLYPGLSGLSGLTGLTPIMGVA